MSYRLEWVLLERYVAGACTPDERRRVEAWLDASPDHRQALEALRGVAMEGNRVVPPGRRAELLAQLRRRNAEEGAPVARTRAFSLARRAVPLPVQIAAMLLIAVGASAITYVALREGLPAGVAEPAPRTIATESGQRLTVRLADGTLATLAPRSTMRIPAAYGERDRTVDLTGEAAFTVTHDSTRPFTVRTGRLVARDLGTRFVVRAYPADDVADVVVAEGKVAVDTVVLERGDRARVAADGRVSYARGVALDPYFAWTEGRLTFDRTPLREVARQVSRWHAIQVELADPRLGALEVTASFQDEPAAEVLQVIAAILSLQVVRHDRGAYTLLSPR